MNQHPTPGRIVHYIGKQGINALRPAMIVTTRETLDPRGVEQDDRLELSGSNNVHLHVFTPSDQGFFTEYDIPYDGSGKKPGTWKWPERTEV